MRLFLLISLACTLPASAQAAHWLADHNSGCQIRNPLPLPDESVSWSGGCNNGKASGLGILRWYAEGKLFLTLTGVMEAGQCRRNCTVSTQSGSSYVGDLRDNRPHGSGTLRSADGSRYTGGWAGGKKHGPGRFTAKDGSSQQELWEQGTNVSAPPH